MNHTHTWYNTVQVPVYARMPAPLPINNEPARIEPLQYIQHQRCFCGATREFLEGFADAASKENKS